ncbi:MAG: hypothetical protein MUF58_03105 [Arcicella sp.]|jgi:hypothetical protein|nr:hypothetical protein [Arcicella sp.]
MGHDLAIIGKHKLNTQSPQKLALDLSKRLKVKVIYQITYWDNNLFDGNGDNVWLEQFTAGEEYEKEYHLTLWVDDTTQLNVETCYEERNLFKLELLDPKDPDYESLNCEIGIDSLLIHCATNQRWYGFIHWIKDPTNKFDGYSETCGEWMEKQRQIIWDNLIPFGGHEVLLFSDQGSLQLFCEDDCIYTKSFEQIKQEMIAQVGEDKVRYLPRELAGYEGKNIYEASDNFQLLYDDFPEKINNK